MKNSFGYYGITNHKLLKLEEKHGLGLVKLPLDIRKSLIIELLFDDVSQRQTSVLIDILDVKFKVTKQECLAILKAVTNSLESLR